MRLIADTLHSQLKKSFLPIYVLYGNEPFLIEESARVIRKAFEEKYAGECQVLPIENAGSWEQLEHTFWDRSLFSTTRLIDLRLFEAKIHVKEAALLGSILERATDDLFFLIQVGSLSRAQQQAKWFTIADQKGALIAHWPLTQFAFSKWLKTQLTLKNIPLSNQLLSELIDYTEGNCLAAAQEIERLALLQSDEKTPLITMHEQQSQFSIFDLVEAAVQQKPERVLHILQALKAMRTAIPLLIWSFAQTVRILSVCESSTDEKKRIGLLSKAGIKPVLHSAYLNRLNSEPSPSSLYLHLSQLDKLFKSGLGEAAAWPALISIGLKLAGVNKNY